MADYITGDLLPLSEINARPRLRNLQEDLVKFPIPLSQWRYANGNTVDATGATGNPKIILGGWGSGTGKLEGQDAHATTKTEIVTIEAVLPECYVAGETVQFNISARYSDSGAGVTYTTRTVDCEIYEVAQHGTAGSDLCTTAAQTLSATMTDFSFAVNAAGLAPGDSLRIISKIVLTTTGGTGAQKAEFGGATLMADIKG